MEIIDSIPLLYDKIIIAGPCALESKAQLKHTVKHLKGMGVKIIRACLWKPRTRPGWEGVGMWGLYYLLEETLPLGLVPATEVLNAEHAKMILEALKSFDEDAKIIVWIGARNQNHFEQRAIAHILADGPPNILLMFKNQMWEDAKHWLGIYEHIVQAGFPKNRLIGCHRGFAPGRDPNVDDLRNLPNFEMAMMVKETLNIPMLLDPSHIAGISTKVFDIVKLSQSYAFNGFMVEVHPDNKNAKTDANQQLSLDEFFVFLSFIQQLQTSFSPEKEKTISDIVQ